MVQLTDEQQEVFLQLAAAGDDRVAPAQIIRELVDMGLLYEDDDKRLQMSAEGEDLFDSLSEDEE
jgi:hypothetical protein